MLLHRRFMKFLVQDSKEDYVHHLNINKTQNQTHNQCLMLFNCEIWTLKGHKSHFIDDNKCTGICVYKKYMY